MAPVVGVALALVGCRVVEPAPVARPDGTGSITVHVRGFGSRDGQLLINLFLARAGFPEDPEAAFVARAVSIDADTVVVRFEDVPAGEFAIAAFHDEDGDRVLDTGALGAPSERWGVSGGSRGFLGPPAYDDARLVLRPGLDIEVEVELQ